MKDLVSIITPSYNSSDFIEDTINAVLSQTYQNWEMIIVDDCSTDHSVEIIQKYIAQDTRIKLVQNQENKGAAEARNKALSLVKGRFIAFLDSDDLWLPHKLEEQLAFMKKHHYPISFTAYRLIDEQGKDMQKSVQTIPFVDYNGYMKNTIIGMSTSMIDRNIVEPFKFINLRTRQDTYLWISLLKKGYKAYGLNQVLAIYRVRENSISANKFQAARRVWHLYYGLEKLNFFRAFYYFCHYAYNAFKKRI
ncbi:MAG: glycosyl transferase [Flavobacteriales bacterium]|nr:MAG: glycosyl transferase [Flavobacteriales bacterium]